MKVCSCKEKIIWPLADSADLLGLEHNALSALIQQVMKLWPRERLGEKLETFS